MKEYQRVIRFTEDHKAICDYCEKPYEQFLITRNLLRRAAPWFIGCRSCSLKYGVNHFSNLIGSKAKIVIDGVLQDVADRIGDIISP